jgi:hypothetical protein
MDKDTIADAKLRFEEASGAWNENYQDALEDIEFGRLGEQWPEAVKRDRERQGRPCLTLNRMPSFIRQVVNDARQNRPRISTVPVGDGGDQQTAKVIDGLIRNIEVASNADVAYDTGVEYAVSGGIGFIRVDVDYASDDTFDMDLRIERVANPFAIVFDPMSTAADSSDWRYAFLSERIPTAQFKKLYKGAAVDWSDSNVGNEDDWFDEDSVRVAEYWSREDSKRLIVQLSNGSVVDAKRYTENQELFNASGLQVIGEREIRSHKVVQRVMSGAEILSETEWAGRYIPIVPVFGEELNVGGKRYFRSLIRDAKDSQRMHNYWRSMTTELVALQPKAPFIGAAGQFRTDPNWSVANQEALSYLEYDQVAGAPPPQRQPFAGVPAGALQEALNASDDMKAIMGLYDASLGARSNETSGRAIMARQREGDTGTFHFLDNLTRAIRHTGRILVDLIPSVYNSQRIIRIVDEEDKTGQVQIGPAGIEGVYDLTAGKYDVVVKAGPGFTSKREEAVNAMVELVRAYPNGAPVIVPEIARNADWPGADKIEAGLRAMLPPQLQGAQDAQIKMVMEQAQVQMQQAQQQLQQLSQENQSLKMQLQNKQGEQQLKAKELEIKAVEVMQSAQPPETGRKVIQITAPSGQTYTGEVVNQQ